MESNYAAKNAIVVYSFLFFADDYHKKVAPLSPVGQFGLSIKVVYNYIAMLMDALIILGILLFVGGITSGIVLLILGFKGKRILGLIRAGWIVIGVVSLIITAGFIELCIKSSFAIVFLIFFIPFVILIGLIATLVLGISNFASKNIKVGLVFIIINLAVVTTIIVLLVMFMTGIIPIRLM